MSLAAPTASRFTYADYLVWCEGRFELIDGEVFDMSPAPARVHQDVLAELFITIREFLRDQACKVYPAPFDVRLPSSSLADELIATVVQPDISIICDRDKLDDRGCVSAPDWIIEIQSPATAVRDQVTKRELYERYGVREYWLVHPTDRMLTRYLLGDGQRFLDAEIIEARGTTTPALFPDLEIVWQRVFEG